MTIGEDFLEYKYPDTLKKISKNLNIFIEITVTVYLFCASPLMTSKSFILEDLTQLNFSYVLGFYVLAEVLFSHFEELKTNFSHRSISLHKV